ncbi:uncharacterized protein [Nicotiana tomentosiformis]|uniref:uncharacterized protein n=1 Tax=Nicotiana tomentosiformis TaxID=4098 RepID=UPI00388CA9EF
MTRSSGKKVLPYELEIEKQLRQLRKKRNLPENTKNVRQSSTKKVMTGDDDSVDLAAREAVQQRENAVRDAEETALRNAQIVYEEERARRIAQNIPLGADQFKKYCSRCWETTGLTPASRRTLSNTAGGLLMKKTSEEIVTILYELSKDANQWPSEIAETRRSTGVHQVDANTSVKVKLDSMAKEIRKLTLASIHSEPQAACDICERGHPTHECKASMEEVNVIGNYNFNSMGQKHPGFSWCSPGDERLDAHGATIKEFGIGLRNLEKQVGQIATILSKRIPVKEPTPIQKEVVPEKESAEQLKNEVYKKKKGKKGTKKKKKEENSRRYESEESKHILALPFPQKLYRKKLDKKFERFLDMLKQVNINFPFTEVLSQMPAYAKFLTEILTKKRNIEETSVVKVTKHFSAILQNKLPQNCGDPGSFTIP